MAITFPSSPTNGQTFTSGNKTWIWDGVTWLAYGASLSPTVLKVDTTNSRVGINNQSPAATLDVQASSGTAMRITNTGTGNSFLVEDSTSTDTTPFVIDAVGRVGVGTASPARSLDVVGEIRTFQSSGNDSVSLYGRTGGTSSFNVMITPDVLTSQRNLTLPNASGTLLHTNNWLPYTPTWETGGTAPVLGNGSVAGRYYQVGKLVFVHIVFSAGTTTTFGTGNFKFTVPITMEAPLFGYQGVEGGGYGEDTSAAAVFIASVNYDNASTARIMVRFNQPAGASYGEVTSTAPFTWANTDRLNLNFNYRIP